MCLAGTSVYEGEKGIAFIISCKVKEKHMRIFLFLFVEGNPSEEKMKRFGKKLCDVFFP